MTFLASFRSQLQILICSEPEGPINEPMTLKNPCLWVQLHHGNSFFISGGHPSPPALTSVLDSPSFWKSFMPAPEGVERSFILHSLECGMATQMIDWRCQGMRLERHAGARPSKEFGHCLNADGEIAKVVNQWKGDDLSVICNITLATRWILDYREAKVEAERPLRMLPM